MRQDWDWSLTNQGASCLTENLSSWFETSFYKARCWSRCPTQTLPVVQVYYVFIEISSLGGLPFKILAFHLSLTYTHVCCWLLYNKLIHLLTGLVFCPAGWHATFLTSRKASRSAGLDTVYLYIRLYWVTGICLTWPKENNLLCIESALISELSMVKLHSWSDSISLFLKTTANTV